MKHRAAIACAWLCAAGLALAACGGASDRGRGEGIVRAVDPASATLTLDHGDIPGVMKAMRMDFAVADPALLEGLEPGDEVRFSVRQDGDRYTLTEVVEMQEEAAE